jgi:hypothetical protein
LYYFWLIVGAPSGKQRFSVFSGAFACCAG